MIYYYSKKDKFSTNLNMESFSDEINKNKIYFENVDEIDSYIDNWRKAIWKTYISEKDKIHSFENEQNYYTKIFIGKSEIRIHFDVKKALSISKKYLPKKIELALFSEDPISFFDEYIKYTKCDDLGEYDYSKDNSPIILVPYLMGDIKYLTIDGNHRITAKNNNKHKYIDAVFLSYEDSKNLLYSDFEKALYLFLREGSDLKKYIKNSDSRLFL